MQVSQEESSKSEELVIAPTTSSASDESKEPLSSGAVDPSSGPLQQPARSSNKNLETMTEQIEVNADSALSRDSSEQAQSVRHIDDSASSPAVNVLKTNEENGNGAASSAVCDALDSKSTDTGASQQSLHDTKNVHVSESTLGTTLGSSTTSGESSEVLDSSKNVRVSSVIADSGIPQTKATLESDSSVTKDNKPVDGAITEAGFSADSLNPSNTTSEVGVSQSKETGPIENVIVRIPLEMEFPSNASIEDIQVAVSARMKELELETPKPPEDLVLIGGTMGALPVRQFQPFKALVPGSILSLIENVSDKAEIAAMGCGSCVNVHVLNNLQQNLTSQLNQLKSGSQISHQPKTMMPGQVPPNATAVDPKAAFKTKMCANFAIGACTYGVRCTFAHGQHELRQLGLQAPKATGAAPVAPRPIGMIGKGQPAPQQLTPGKIVSQQADAGNKDNGGWKSQSGADSWKDNGGWNDWSDKDGWSDWKADDKWGGKDWGTSWNKDWNEWKSNDWKDLDSELKDYWKDDKKESKHGESSPSAPAPALTLAPASAKDGRGRSEPRSSRRDREDRPRPSRHEDRGRSREKDRDRSYSRSRSGGGRDRGYHRGEGDRDRDRERRRDKSEDRYHRSRSRDRRGNDTSRKAKEKEKDRRDDRDRDRRGGKDREKDRRRSRSRSRSRRRK